MGRDIVSQKVRFSASKLTCNSKPLVDQSSPDFFSSNAGGISLVHTSFRFWICCLIPEIFEIKVWIGPKLTEILHVFGPKFFGGEPPEVLERDYKIEPDSDHVAKFQGDRFRDLGERVAKKDTSRVKYKPVPNNVCFPYRTFRVCHRKE